MPFFHATGCHSVLWEVIEHPRFRHYDLSSVRNVGYGGAPAAPELVRRIKAVFPTGTPGNGYGLTETSSVTTFNGAADYERKPDSVGAPVPVCEVKIVAPDDPSGKALPVGEIGGENVYCVEIESVLYDHPAVMDAAVVGIPHRVLGEEVGAIVTVKPGARVSQEQLRQHVAARLASFKVPVKIEIRTEPLPRNANGKIVKRELREEMAKRWGS